MIHYVTGDAIEASGHGNKIIAHICNDVGGWGRGFVLSVGKKWPHVEADYRNWYHGNPPLPSKFGSSNFVPSWPPFALGNVRCVQVSQDTWVANMIAQHGILPKDDGTPPIRYGALEECLKHVGRMGATVHMPRIGCGLAGGKWSEVEPIILRAMPDIDVFVHDFDTGDARTVPWNK